MKDTLKMQGVTRPVVGMKKIIDYYNENYTRKKEYICKDLKPARMLNVDEYKDFLNDAGLMTPLEIHYYPLFKVPKIKDNSPISIGYILKTDDKEYKGIMKRFRENEYRDSFMSIGINKDEIVLGAYDMSIDKNNCSLTLHTYSPELPKLEYPKNKMDMYRAYNFISTVADYTDDGDLGDYIESIELPYPNNIDEINLYFDEIWHCDGFDVRKNAYFVNPDKDNYYTILDAIKKGKTIYRNLNNPLVNWSINNEEKWIKFNRNIAIANETGWIDLEK